MQSEETVTVQRWHEAISKDRRAATLATGAAAPFPCTPERRAVLVFAEAAALDLWRRRWPKDFGTLFGSLPAEAGGAERADVHYFVTPGFSLPDVPAGRVHPQAGATFGERLENAIELLARLGYESIVIVGRDWPELETSDSARAFSFSLLTSRRLVLGPDHRGGCYLIGLHSSDRLLLRHVRWQQDSDCQELQERFGRESTALLTVKQDLDTLADVQRLARSTSRWRQVAARLLEALQTEHSQVPSHRVDSRERRMRIDWQLPPPAYVLSR
jgi:hypothetical protein